MTVRQILQVVAIALIALHAFGFRPARLHLAWLGVALWLATVVVV